MRSGHKVYLFFSSLSVAILLAVLFAGPGEKPQNGASEERPLVELSDFTYYLIEEDAVGIIARVKNGLRFHDRDELQNVHILHRDTQERTEELKARLALYDRKDVHFPKGLNYTREDGVHFFTERSTYAMDEERFTSEGPFRLVDPYTEAAGENLQYDRKNGKIRADRIQAQTELR